MLDSLEKTLPRDSYLDDASFQKEWRAIFEQSWVCVGRANALPQPGDYLALCLHNQSVIVVRDEAGGLSAFYNVCRHRGTELVPLTQPCPITGR